ncbi:MAG: hypothetical protein O2966_07675 [Proteobacteria bacterium]|nr:hypothetical protein [Pseudomonadota bacterium]
MERLTLLLILSIALISTAEARERSQKAKNDFKHTHPCPANGNNYGRCPGYIIDHIQALACGGADASSNMQWQSEAESKAKDKWERNGCSAGINKIKIAPSSGEYYSGKRGGCFTYGANGKKHYVAHSYCGR